MAKLTTNVDGPVKERAEFEVLPVHRNSPTEIEIDGRVMRAGRSGAFKVSDYGLAKEIDARYGHDKGGDKSLLLVPVQKRQDPDHARTFRVTLPKGYKREAKKFGG